MTADMTRKTPGTGSPEPAGARGGDGSAHTESARAILDAAERLFSTKGFSAVSMREIAAASERHLASANYYFGSKVGLFEAAFLRRIVPVNARRLDLLERYRAAGRTDLEDVMDAYLQPLFDPDEPDPAQAARLIMLFSKQLLSNPGEHEYLQEYYDEVARAFIAAIQAARPRLTPTAVVWGYNYMIGILVFTLAGQENLARIPAGTAGLLQADKSPQETIARLKRFICAGIDSLG